MIVVTFCPPCGDRVPGLPHETTGGLDGTQVYTYVQTSPDRYDNMARLAGKQTHGMPAYLRVEHDHGDVIVPVQDDGAPVVVLRAPHDDLAVGLSIVGTLLFALGVRALRRRRRHVPRL